MRIRSAIHRIAIPAIAIGLITSGCSSDTGVTANNVDIGGTNDINPVDPGQLRNGGNLRIAISAFPASFNALHVDGNDSDFANYVVAPTLPETFASDAKGDLSIDHNYFTDIQLTNTSPQTVVYTINPQAVWSDGTPITWEDMRSEAQAMAGASRGYQVAAVGGFDRIAKVERGADDRQAVVTFSQPYSEWKAQFSPLYPKAVTESPAAFNDFARNTLPISAGPFMVGPVDRTQNRITLLRNPKWWGPAPKLDTITVSVLDHSAWLAGVQNNEIDYAQMSGLEMVTTARATPGIAVRRTPEPTFSHLTFNGAPGAILADPKLRSAIAKGIDRQAIVTTSQHGIVKDPKPLNNHVFMAGQTGYQDNSSPVTFDPSAAAAELDALGWKLNGDVREKDGRKLVLRDVMYQQDQWVDIAKIIQQDLAKIGVKVEIQTVPGTNLSTDYWQPGNFDLTQFTWVGGAFPFASLPQIYAYDPNNLQGNFGRIGSPEINGKIEQVMAELDPGKANALANDVDKDLWQEVFSLPLNQSPGNYAVRDNLANIGAFGLATPDWTKVGFLK